MGDEEGIPLLNCMQDMALLLDESGIIIEFNPACERLGYTRDELIGSRFDALFPVEQKQMVEHMLSVVAEWKMHDFRATLLTKDEQPLDVHCAASRIEGEAGRFALVLLRDTTLLKRLDEALCEQGLLSRLLETSKEGVLLLDDHSRIVRWSPALEDMSGFSYDEVVGRDLWQVVDWLKPEDVEDSTDTHEAFVKSFKELLSGGVSEFLKKPREARIRARDEKEHYIEVSASTLEQTEERKVVHVATEKQTLSSVVPRKRRMLLAVVRDITERKRNELEKTEGERRYSQLAESLFMSIYILQDGLFTYANPRLCELLGYELDELVGMPFTDIVHVEDRGSVEDIFSQLSHEKDGGIKHELRIITKEGKTRWMYASASTTDWKGREAVLGSMFDITERKLARAELEELLSVQKLIASMSEYLLIPKNIHDAIDECLNEMGKALHVGEACLLKLDDGQMSITNEYLMYGMPPLLHSLESVPVEDISWLLKNLEQGMVHSSHVHGASEAERRFASMLGASTAAVVPLHVRDKLWGILAVATDERAAPIPQTSQILQVASELMSMRLEHHASISELKKERDFVHSLLETTEALVVMLDREGRITYLNSACEKATGYRSEDVLGKLIWEQLVPQEYVEDVKGVFSELMESNLAGHHVNPLLTRGGGERIISWSNTVLAEDDAVRVLSVGIDITALIKAEEALKARDELLRGVLSSLSEHIAVLDAQGNIINTNDAWDRFALENESHDLTKTGVGANYLEVCRVASMDDADEVYEGIRAVLDGSSPVFHFEYDCHSPQEERWFLMYITPLGGEQGGAVVSHINITERKKAERLIERSLELEKVITNISSRFVGARDMDDAIDTSLAEMGGVSGASRVYLFLLNEDRTTVSNTHEWCASGVKSQKHTLQDMPTAAFSWWVEKLEAGETINIEDVSKLPEDAAAERKTLERQDIKAVLVLPVYMDGELSGFVGFDNTTETGKWKEEDVLFLRLFSELLGTALGRSRSENKLKESERRYRELAEQLPDPLMEADGDFNLSYANRAALVAFGLTREHIDAGFNVLELVPPSEHAVIADERDAVLRGAPSGPTEYTLKRADGTEFTAEIHFAPIYRMNEVVGMRGVVRDITERKQHELALLSAKQEAELYIDLMSHDINNLNTVAYGYLYLLLEDKTISGKHKKALERALISIDGITRLISNLQRLREITHTERKLVPMDIDAVVEASILEVAHSHGSTVEHEHSGLKVLADPLLAEVMNNLVGNAIKHGGEGVHIWVRVEQADDNVRILVEDNGRGISDALKPVIFNRLERGEGTVHGRGLGLFIVFTLVESYGGRVWVEDRVEGKPEEGARFVIELKRA
ncbi:MAG: PAS domain S-box protein [Methermicoccaceae archaeon]